MAEPTTNIIGAMRFTFNRMVPNPLRERARRLLTTRPRIALLTTDAGLIELRRVDIQDTDTLTSNLNGITADDGSITSDRLGCCSGNSQRGKPHANCDETIEHLAPQPLKGRADVLGKSSQDLVAMAMLKSVC